MLECTMFQLASLQHLIVAWGPVHELEDGIADDSQLNLQPCEHVVMLVYACPVPAMTAGAELPSCCMAKPAAHGLFICPRLAGLNELQWHRAPDLSPAAS